MTLDRDNWWLIAVLAGLLVLYLAGILTLRWIWHATGRRRRPIKYLLRFLLISPVLMPLSLTAWLAIMPSSIRLHTIFPDVVPSDISNLVSSHNVWGGDDLFIGFTAPAGVVDDIVRRYGLKPYGDFPINGEKPGWWSDNACSQGKNPWGLGDYKIYASGEMKDHPRGWEHIMLLYCGRDGQVLIDAREPID